MNSIKSHVSTHSAIAIRRLIRSRTWLFSGLALCTIVSGCIVSSVFYQYDGSPRASSDETVLSIVKGDGLRFQGLDGKELANRYTTWNGGSDAVKEIHMLPGVHQVSGEIQKENVFSYFNFKYDFLAGKKYRLIRKIEGYDMGVVPTAIPD